MIITKKHLSRRTVLRGLGASLALPLFDSMVPALVASRRTAANPVRRFGAVYIPMGVAIENWTPPAEGKLQMSPILHAMEPFADQAIVLSGLDSPPAFARADEGAGQHSRTQAAWLTAAHAKRTDGADFEAGISMDQIIAGEFGQQTALSSLELALESSDVVGACDYGYACAYTSTIAWRSSTTPLPMEIEPGAVFERLFGDSGSTDPKVRLARIRQSRSILDALSESITDLERELGKGDRARLQDYLASVRDVETRVRKAEEHAARELPDISQPVGVPQSFEEYAKLMFDLLVLAFQSDVTRVGTFLIARELSNRTYPEIGVADAHHPLTHHGVESEKIARLSKVNAYHVKLFTYLLEKLRSTPDGDGSLLDHSILLFGSGMSNPSQHLNVNVPTMVVGGGAGQLKGGRHIKVADGTPLGHLQLTLMEKLGVPRERFGDSDARLSGL